MSSVASRFGAPLVLAIGRRTGRERQILTLTVFLVVLALCHRGWLAPALAEFHTERVRLAAGRALNQRLVGDLATRDEVMVEAEGQIERYLATREVAPSVMFLEHVRRSETRGARLQSFHVSGDGTGPGNVRLQVVLHGPPGAVAEAFLDLSLAQPPIVLRQLLVRAQPGTPAEVTASATLETMEGADDAEWAGLFDHWRASQPEAFTVGAGTASVVDNPIAVGGDDRQRFEYLGRGDLFEIAALGGGASTSRGGTSVQVAASDLFLVGVVGGPSPFAILQERSTGKRHYLHSGEYLGEIRVARIGQRSVVLSYKGEELSLP